MSSMTASSLPIVLSAPPFCTRFLIPVGILAIQFEDRRIECIKTILGFLPAPNYTLLIYLAKAPHVAFKGSA